MKRLNINIRTLSPVILTASKGETVLTEAQDYIKGSIIRGVLANSYISKKNLKDAHLDSDFCKLFFDKISFVDAMPLCNEKNPLLCHVLYRKPKQAARKTGRLQIWLLMTKCIRALKAVVA